jgi:hypothetical protein
MPKISCVKIEENQEEQKTGNKKTHKITVNLSECSKNARLHAIATQFVPHDPF